MPKKLFAKKLSKTDIKYKWHFQCMESLYAFQIPEGEHSKEFALLLSIL
jgi:hypothetical protein